MHCFYVKGPDLDEFKLVVDSVESLRQLAEEFEDVPATVTGSGKREKVKQAYIESPFCH